MASLVGVMCGRLQLSSAAAASALVLCSHLHPALHSGSVGSALRRCCAPVRDLVQRAPAGTGGVRGRRAVKRFTAGTCSTTASASRLEILSNYASTWMLVEPTAGAWSRFGACAMGTRRSCSASVACTSGGPPMSTAKSGETYTLLCSCATQPTACDCCRRQWSASALMALTVEYHVTGFA